MMAINDSLSVVMLCIELCVCGSLVDERIAGNVWS